MRRWLPFLLFGLALVGLGMLLSDYASNQAGMIAGDTTQEPESEVDPVQVAACERAQARYDELWDASLENPDDMEKEEELGVALGELYDACGANMQDGESEQGSPASPVETIDPGEIDVVK